MQGQVAAHRQRLEDDEDGALAWLRYASEQPNKAKKIEAALEQNGDGLQHVSAHGRLAEHPELYRRYVMTAVHQNGRALRFASEALRDDEDVVTAAVAQDGRARAYASAELRGLTKYWMAPHNVLVLPEGICRAKTFNFSRSELEVVDSAPLTRRETVPQKVPSKLNILKMMVGRDVDGDGDVGKADQAVKSKRRQQIEAQEREQGDDLDGDGVVGSASSALEVGTCVRDISPVGDKGQRKATFATPAIAAMAIGTVVEVSPGEALGGGDDGFMYRVAYPDERAILAVLNLPSCTRERAYDVFRGAAPEIQAMREVAERAVAVHGGALEFVSEELRKDPELVKTAVAQNGYALRFAFGGVDDSSEKQLEDAGQQPDGQVNLKGKDDVVIAATTKCTYMVQREVGKFDEQTGLQTTMLTSQWVTSGGNRGALRYADPATQAIVLERATTEKRARLRRTRDRFSVAKLRNNGYALKHAPAEIQADRQFVLPAVTDHGAALEFASAELQDDEEIVRAALRQKPFTKPIVREVVSHTSVGQERWDRVELIKTWDPDMTAWSLMPGSSRRPGEHMDPHDVFAVEVPVNVADDDEDDDVAASRPAITTRNPFYWNDDELELRTVEIEDVLYYDDVVYTDGRPATEARLFPLSRRAQLPIQQPVKDAAGNIMTEPVRDENGKPVEGHDGKPLLMTVFVPRYRRVDKNWQVLKFASRRLQEDMEFLARVREEVRNDDHEMQLQRRTAEKEVLMGAQQRSETDLAEEISAMRSVAAAFQSVFDSRDARSETRAERIEKDAEIARAKFDLRAAQASVGAAASRHVDLQLQLATLHLEHVYLKVQGPKCVDWSVQRKGQEIAEAELPVARLKESFAATRLKCSRTHRREIVAANKLRQRMNKKLQFDEEVLTSDGKHGSESDWSEASSSSSSSSSSSDSDSEGHKRLSKSLKKARKLRIRAERAAVKAEKAAKRAAKSGTEADAQASLLASKRATHRAIKASASSGTD